MLGQQLIEKMRSHYSFLIDADKKPELGDFIEDVLVCRSYTSAHTWHEFYRVVEDNSGKEDSPEQCSIVFSYAGKLYKADFTYCDHIGHNYEGFVASIREVREASKTVTIYV